MTVKFRRYGNQPADIRRYIQDRQCQCRGAFHQCRDCDLLSTLQGCKCAGSRLRTFGNCPVTENLVLGSNVLIDGGVELEFGIHGGFVVGEIPFIDFAVPTPPADPWAYNDSGGNHIPTSLTSGHYVQGDDFAKALSTANPRSGSYHIRSPNNFGTSERNYLANFRTASGLYFAGTNSIVSFYTARVDPGSLVSYSAYWAAANAPGATRTSSFAFLGSEFYDTSGNSLGRTEKTFANSSLPQSYTLITQDVVAPANSFYVINDYRFDVSLAGTGLVNSDIDDFSVVVQ